MKIASFKSNKQLLQFVLADHDIQRLISEAGQQNAPIKAELDALNRGDFEAYKKLKAEGQRFDWVDANGYGAMHVAAIGGNVKILDDLLNTFNLDINAQTSHGGETPILLAVSHQRMEAARFLRGRGADLNIKPMLANNFHQRVRAYGIEI